MTRVTRTFMSTAATPAFLFVWASIASVGACKPSDEPVRLSADNDPSSQADDEAVPQAKPPQSPGLIRLVATEPGDVEKLSASTLAEPQRELLASPVYQRLQISAEVLRSLTAPGDTAARKAVAERLTEGGSAEKAGQVQAAYDAYGQALERIPGHPQALVGRARTALALGWTTEALKQLAFLKASPLAGAETVFASVVAMHDFVPLHSEGDFIALTGARPIEVHWPANTEHKPAVEVLLQRLREAGFAALRGAPITSARQQTLLHPGVNQSDVKTIADELEAVLNVRPLIEDTPLGDASSPSLALGKRVLLRFAKQLGIRHLYDRVLVARAEGASERLKLNATGFFTWESLLDDGTEIRRTGRYHLTSSRLALDFKQSTERPATGGAAPSLSVEQGRREAFDINLKDAVLEVGSHRFSVASEGAP